MLSFKVKKFAMKKIYIILILTLFTSAPLVANELANTLNKVYDKGSQVAEEYLTNILSGPGETEVSLSVKNENKPTGTIMIVRPLSIHDDTVTFYQAQLNSYHVLGDVRQSINYGIGKRFLSADNNTFWGLNTFLDYDIESNSRLGIGSEFKASKFSITGNYYFGVGGDNTVGSNTERVLDGYDFNVAGQAPYAPWANISYTNYNWDAEKAASGSDGDIYSLSLNLTNNLTLEAGLDDNNLQDSMDFIKLIYSRSDKNRPTVLDGFSNTAFTNFDVSEDMLRKVKRSKIITLEVESSGIIIANGN